MLKTWRGQAAGLAAVLTLCMVALDRPLSRAARHLPGALLDLAGTVTVSGIAGYSLVPLALAVPLPFATRYGLRTGKTAETAGWIAWALVYLFAVDAVSGLLVDLLKVLFGRARPRAWDLHGLYGFYPPGWRFDFQSFPSGHSATWLSLAVGLGLIVPRLRWPLLALGGLLTTSRVLVHAHYPADIIGGGAIGGYTALWLRNVFARRRLVFFRRPDGSHGVRAPGIRLLKGVWGRLVPAGSQTNVIGGGAPGRSFF